jgi:hypothetical protein
MQGPISPCEGCGALSSVGLRVSPIVGSPLRVVDPVEDPEALEGSLVEELQALCCSVHGTWGFIFWPDAIKGGITIVSNVEASPPDLAIQMEMTE